MRYELFIVVKNRVLVLWVMMPHNVQTSWYNLHKKSVSNNRNINVEVRRHATPTMDIHTQPFNWNIIATDGQSNTLLLNKHTTKYLF
jgi:hypothetical protein